MSMQGTTSRGLVLVSHDKDLRRQLRACLSGLGMAASGLTTVRNGHECLPTLARVRPRLVVLDDSVSEPEGLALLRMLHQRNPEVLIVYLTTHHTLELERAVRQLGVLYYTEKPLDSFLLSRVLSSVFATAAGPRDAVPPPARRDDFTPHRRLA